MYFFVNTNKLTFYLGHINVHFLFEWNSQHTHYDHHVFSSTKQTCILNRKSEAEIFEATGAKFSKGPGRSRYSSVKSILYPVRIVWVWVLPALYGATEICCVMSIIYKVNWVRCDVRKHRHHCEQNWNYFTHYILVTFWQNIATLYSDLRDIFLWWF